MLKPAVRLTGAGRDARRKLARFIKPKYGAKAAGDGRRIKVEAG